MTSFIILTFLSIVCLGLMFHNGRLSNKIKSLSEISKDYADREKYLSGKCYENGRSLDILKYEIRKQLKLEPVVLPQRMTFVKVKEEKKAKKGRK